MGKVWVLDTETKGTGANMVPLEKTQAKPAPKSDRPRRRPKPATAAARPAAPAKPKGPVETSRSALPPGHVRKKGTGEIGKVQAVDPRAGTATVFWLKRGSASTVPLASISRR